MAIFYFKFNTIYSLVIYLGLEISLSGLLSYIKSSYTDIVDSEISKFKFSIFNYLFMNLRS